MNPIFKLSPKAQYEIGRILYGKYMLPTLKPLE